MDLVALTAVFVSVVAAVRSTWSPCGLSMLSTITPLSEQGRGNRYGVTVGWFVLGAALGGATLGLGLACLAVVVLAIGPTTGQVALAASAAALVAIASDARFRGFRLPGTHRQVDEVWLTGFRPWVYGLGFGWQIGVGLTTYLTTAAVYLTCVLAALTASPPVAFAVGLLFGVVRGLAVLAGARLTTPAALRSLHARLASLDRPAARWTVGAMVLVAVTSAAAVAPLLAGVVAVVCVVLVGSWVRTSGATPSDDVPRAARTGILPPT